MDVEVSIKDSVDYTIDRSQVLLNPISETFLINYIFLAGSVETSDKAIVASIDHVVSESHLLEITLRMS